MTGVDYSHEALRLARSHDERGVVDFRYLNINDRASLLEFGAWMLSTGDEWCIFAHHSAQAITKANRQGLYLFLDLVLRGRCFADLTSDTTMSAEYEHAKPSTWHLPTAWLEEEAQERPLDLRVVRTGRRMDVARLRRIAQVRITHAPATAGPEQKDR